LRTLPPGGKIPESQTRPALDLDRLLNGFKPLFQGLNPAQTNQLATSLIEVLNGEAGTIDTLVQQIASLTTTLADRDALIGEVIGNLNGVLGTLDDNGRQLSDLLTQLQQLVSGLDQDRGPILDSLADINSVAGTAASLVADARAPLAADVGQIVRLSSNINQSKDIVNMALGKLPGVYKLIGRGAYGNFFNFYLCGVSVKVSGPLGPITTPEIDSPVQRCQFPK
jgi:phospholipid/cholesterol/gamma-HCH transport system substrate-binding protein